MQAQPKGGLSARPGRPSINPASLPGPINPEERLSWFSPGRVIRVPVGYLIVALLLILSLAITGYIVGYKKRDRDLQRQAELALARQFDGVTDPLALSTPPTGLPPSPRPPQLPQSTNATTPTTPTTPANPANRSNQTINAPNTPNTTLPKSGRVFLVRQPADDPRQVGRNYLVVAQLAMAEAERAANFLAAKGLEIAVVSVDNRSSTAFVVVVQGFGPGEWYGPDGKRLERDVQALGREYKRDDKGPVDFSDAWWQKFK